MAPANKTTDATRRKSGSGKAGQQPSLIVNLNVKSADLGRLLSNSTQEDTPSGQDTQEATLSPESSAQATQPTNANGENASDSNVATPMGEGTPVPPAMGPPSDNGKKKGVKRAAPKENGASDGLPKQRGKPGPKKKQKLEDGTGEPTPNRSGAGHKLGPKANLGAINAGLRALDRSGKPCRKWARGNFQLKSFTGVSWEISRWTAPPKKAPESGTEDSAVPSADNSSGKENKENAPGVNSASNSNSGADAEMRSATSNHASPATMAIAAAS